MNSFEPLSQPNVNKDTVLAALNQHFSSNQEANDLLELIKNGYAALWLFDPEVAKCALEVEQTEYDVVAYVAAAKHISLKIPGVFVNYRLQAACFGIGHSDGSTAQIKLKHLRGKGRGKAFVEALRQAVMDF
jgi:hypothetical protein